MIQEMMSTVYFGNSILKYLSCFLFFIISFFSLRVFKSIILKSLKRWAAKTKTSLDDFFVKLVEKIFVPLLSFGIFYIVFMTLDMSEYFRKIINVLGVAVLTFYVAKSVTFLIEYGFNIYCRKKGNEAIFAKSMDGILRMVKFIVWSFALIFFFDNLGFKVTAVIAGLGVGGVAVALAAQAVLGDLFSYFAILFDRPFEIGDFIIIGDYMGVVEHVGIKTTRISSLGGEQLIFSNSDLTNSRVRNYKRMNKRRVVFKLGVVYQTSLQRAKEIPDIIKNIITSINETTFDRAHFFSYGDSSLIYEVVYYVSGSDYNKYMDIQQEINLAIKQEFESKAIEFAYPTQTLYIAKEDQ